MYTFFWRDNKNSLRLLDAYFQGFVRSRLSLIKTIDNIFIFSDNLEQSCYVDSENLKLASQKGKKFFLNKNFIENLFREIDQDIDNFRKLVLEIKKLNLSKINNTQLIKYFGNFNSLTLKIFIYYIICQAEFFYGVEEHFLNVLMKKSDRKVAQQYLSTLVTSTLFDKSMLAQLDWVEILSKKHISDKSLLNYAHKYPALFFPAVWSWEEVINTLKKKIKDDKKRIDILKKENRKILKEKRDLKEKQQVILKKYGPEIKFLSWLLQTWGIKRFDLKFCWAGSEFILSNFFNEIAKRIDVKLEDLMFTYRENEIEKALRFGKVLLQKEIEARYRYYFFGLLKGKLVFFSGEKAYSMAQKLIELSGQTANIGNTKGRVRIVIPSSLEGLKKFSTLFKKGEILVTPMTQPNMVPLIRKAKAIITDEGGITSHAAIVSREFNIPCVVGTKKATKVLKDGDLVEVDADKGIVKILEKK